MWKRLGDWLQPWCEQLIDEMLSSAFLHADETGWRICCENSRRWMEATLLKKYGGELLVFLRHPEVPPTNNHAEWEIRPAATMRKMIGGNQSETEANAVDPDDRFS